MLPYVDQPNNLDSSTPIIPFVSLSFSWLPEGCDVLSVPSSKQSYSHSEQLDENANSIP